MMQSVIYFLIKDLNESVSHLFTYLYISGKYLHIFYHYKFNEVMMICLRSISNEGLGFWWFLCSNCFFFFFFFFFLLLL